MPSTSNYLLCVSSTPSKIKSNNAHNNVYNPTTGLLFSSTAIPIGTLSSTFLMRAIILRTQSLQEKNRELNDVQADLYRLLLDLTPDAPTQNGVLHSKIINSEGLHSLAYRCKKLLYAKGDHDLDEAWWHDEEYPEVLGETDMIELQGWIRICLYAIDKKRENLVAQAAYEDLGSMPMEGRLKDKLVLPRGPKKRLQDAREVKLGKGTSKITKATEEPESRQMLSYSGIAGLLAGAAGLEQIEVGVGFLERPWETRV
jgi:hypothetical protein